MSGVHGAQVMNLSALLAQTAALHPDRPGLIQGERQWTWREINARVDACVQALRELGMKPGDKLLVQSRNGLAMFESCWAAFRLGAVWVKPRSCSAKTCSPSTSTRCVPNRNTSST